MSDAATQPARKTLLLLTVDTESSMAGLRPLPPEAMVYGRVAGGTWGIERIMDCCEARGVKATFFVSTLEELHHGREHVGRMCATILDRGHDVQVHLHPNWWKGDFARKRLTDYSLAEQTELVGLARDAYRRACGCEPVAHRAGGLLINADTLRALEANGIRVDSSVAPGHIAYALGAGVEPPNVPRRLGGVAELPVTTFAQVRLGAWAPRRHLDVNADSLSELQFVVNSAVEQGVAAVCLLMHSFSFLRRNQDGTAFSPAAAELRRFERFLDFAAAHDGVEVVTVREMAGRLAADPRLLAGPDFDPTSGLCRTYARSWERFGTGWKSKALALGLPALAALTIGAIWWLTS